MNSFPIFLRLVPFFIASAVWAVAETPPDSATVTLQLPNAQIDTILLQYEMLTGKRVLKGPNLAGPPVHLVIRTPVATVEATRLIEAALLLNGYALVPGPDNTVKAVAVSQKNPRSEGVPIFTRLEDLPPGDQVVSLYIPLTYIDSAKFAGIVTASGSGNPFSSVLELKDAGAVVVTDTTSYIRHVARLKELSDVPPARLTREFVQLRHADAERVAEVINQLIQGRRQNQQPGTPGEPPPAGVAGSANLLTGDIQLTPDRRTNRILVICSPVAYLAVRELIEQFDQSVGAEKPVVRPLKYVSSSDVLPVLGELLAEDGDAARTAAGSDAPARSAASGASRAAPAATGRAAGLSKDDQLDAPEDDQAPVSLSVGKTRLIADKRANSILIIGSPESVTKVSALLDTLDVQPRQVFLSTVIGQLTLSRETEFGVDILNKYNKGIAGQSNQARSTPFIDPKTLLSAAAFPGTGGLTLYGAFGDTIDAYVRAFETTNNFKVLSRPSVFTANNKKAVIVSGRREPIPEQTIRDVSTGNTNSSINFEDVVLKLEVIPLINSDNEVTLRIAQQNDSIVDNRVIDDNSIPVISTQMVVTTVTVANNSTVILGGLIEDEAQKQISGVPFLKDIPLLGYLFKTTRVERPRRELVVMIQPRVIAAGQESQPASDLEANRYLVAPDAREAADTPKPVRTQIHKFNGR